MAKVKPFKDFVQDDSFVIKITHDPIIVLTGAVFDVTIKENPDDVTPITLASYTVPAGGDADAGIANIPITREITSAVPEGDYYASIKRTIGVDTITLLRTGKGNIDKVTCYKTLTEKVV